MMKIYTGTSGFAHKEWIGKFYPEKIPPKEMLRFYAGRLNTVEINNTFYHMPSASVLASWAGQVPPDFIIALKAPQVITHMKQLRHVSSESRYLFNSLSVLERKLGPVLFQFPASFRENHSVLEDFLALVPRGTACAFDFRSPSWFDAETLNLLREKGCSWCIEDTDEKPVLEITSTAAWGYLRLRRSDYTEAGLSEWAERILAQQWERAFVYFKHEEKGAELAMQFQSLVDSRLAGKGLKTAGTRA